MSTNLTLDRASKNLQAMVAAAAKAAADLGTLSAEAIAESQRIEDLKAQADALAQANEVAVREASVELKLRVKEDRDVVLAALLKEDGLARISVAEVEALSKQLAGALADNSKELQAAVAAAVAAAQREAKNAALEVEATTKVANAEKEATIQAQNGQIEFLKLQVADLRKQIDDERTTRLAIAQADAGKQGVIVNTGK